jgi:putative nucleotidyltransferase with HDIG domain
MDKVDLRTLKDKVEGINTLPTLPKVLKQILSLIENPRISLGEISKFISNDPVLTAKVLKMVNSPVYGFPGRISSVNQAVVLLGLNVIKGLLLGVTVFELMQKAMTGLWEHSVGCAVTARLMAIKKGLKEPEEVTVCGLLHDLGKVILVLQYPELYEKTMKTARVQGVSVSEVERDYFGTIHSTVGTWMAQKWNFPKMLIDVIQNHHKPSLAKQAPVETAIVHLSDILVRGRGFGFAGDNQMPPLDVAAWDRIGLSEKEIKELLEEMEDSMEAPEDLSP